MTDRDALQQAVAANPEDDTLRLIFADWFEESGDLDRAEFIRCQIAASRAEPDSPRQRVHTQRAKQLLQSHELLWLNHLDPLILDAGFERGFIDEVMIDADHFLRVAEELFTNEPIRRLRLIDFPESESIPDLAAVLQSSWMSRVRGLTLEGFRGEGARLALETGLDQLLESDSFRGLTELSLAGNPIPPTWLTHLLRSDRLQELTDLDLADIPNLGPALADGLDQAGHRRILTLDLSGIYFPSGTLHRILTAPSLEAVVDLKLNSGRSGSGTTNHGLPTQLQAINLGWLIPWGCLRSLELNGQRIGDEGLSEIVRARSPFLRRLGLAGCSLTRDCVPMLVSAPQLDLYHLNVADNGLGMRDIERLRDRFPQAAIIS